MICVCDYRTPASVLDSLKKEFNIVQLPPDTSLPDAVCGHSDLLIFRLGNHLITRKSYYTAAKGEICKELLIKLGIDEESFKKFPAELSGGMARRVSLARAIAKDADIYLFDEPFSGLDSENAERTAKVIKEYCKNKTCIIVSHNKELSKILADDFLQL